jgi:thiopurine S-methyltransferase
VEKRIGYGREMVDAKFWHERWRKNEIGFHEGKPNPSLVKFVGRLGLRKGARVFVPLCGKTRDIGWLLGKGFRVAGAELSEVAVAQLFEELKVEPKISAVGKLKKYRAKNLEIFVGDVFAVTRKALGRVDAIYDRAALVALPELVRKRYTAHLMRITDRAPQLLLSFEYDQRVMEGPPFSITNAELVAQYGKDYELILLSSATLPDGLKGKWPATENAWLLRRKTVSV